MAYRDVRLGELKGALSKHVAGFDLEFAQRTTLVDALRYAAETLLAHVGVIMSGGPLDRFAGKDVQLRDKLRGTAADSVSFVLPGEARKERRKESVAAMAMAAATAMESNRALEQEVYVLGVPSEEEDAGEEVVSSAC